MRLRFLPGERFILRSNLTQNEIRERMRRIVAPKRELGGLVRADLRTTPY